MHKEYIGKVAICKRNKVGIIQQVCEIEEWTDDYPGKVKSHIYLGETPEGRPWQSRQPRIIANSLEEYNGQKIR